MNFGMIGAGLVMGIAAIGSAIGIGIAGQGGEERAGARGQFAFHVFGSDWWMERKCGNDGEGF